MFRRKASVSWGEREARRAPNFAVERVRLRATHRGVGQTTNARSNAMTTTGRGAVATTVSKLTLVMTVFILAASPAAEAQPGHHGRSANHVRYRSNRG